MKPYTTNEYMNNDILSEENKKMISLLFTTGTF